MTEPSSSNTNPRRRKNDAIEPSHCDRCQCSRPDLKCLDANFRQILTIGGKQLDMEFGFFSRIETEDSCSIVRSDIPAWCEIPGEDWCRMNAVICRRAGNETQPFHVEQCSQGEQDEHEVMKHLGLQAYIACPVAVGGKVFGVVFFLSTRSRLLPFNEQEFELIQLLAGWIGREIELKLADSGRQQSDRLVQAIYDTANDAILHCNEDGFIESANPVTAEIFDFEIDDLVGMHITAIIPEHQPEDYIGRRWQQNGVRRDGMDIPLAISCNRIDLASQRLYSYIIHDLSEQKEIEYSLHISEQRYALAAEASNDGLWDWDLVSNKVHYSTRWKKILGYEEHEIADTPGDWFSLILSNDLHKLQCELSVLMNGRADRFRKELRMIHKNGRCRWIQCSGVAVRDSNEQVVRLTGSISDITDRKRIEKALQRATLHDRLTALPNRTLLLDRLEKAIQRSMRINFYRYAVLYIDIDRFKIISESLGRSDSDRFLVNTARRLKSQLRRLDTAARIDGDEFVVLLDGINDSSEVHAVAQRVQKIIGQPNIITEHEIIASASIGIATSDMMYERPEDVLRDAEIAMQHAKAQGRGQCAVFDQDMRNEVVERLYLENDLRKAIEEEQFIIHYQPILSLESGQTTGMEALIRWQHPYREMVRPDQFIPISEETSLIVPIGEWVLRNACRQLKYWQTKLPHHKNLVMNVNVSKCQLTNNSFIDMVKSVLDETGVNPPDIILEITENTIMNQQKEIVPLLSRIKNLGVKLAMDDFGTGYSSLSSLHKFPIDILKIDRAFINSMGEKIKFVAVIQAIITLARTLNIKVVAEGIETENQLSRLQALDCGYAQGFYFAKPMDIENAEFFLAQKRWASESA